MNEAAQFLTFELDTINASLFTVPPAVSVNGTLTYAAAADAFGIATVTLRLRDNGGTIDGGQDTSPAQTFEITLRPVNDAPSYVGGNNQLVDEDSGPIAVSGWATNLVAGPPNEAGQVLSFVIVENSNPALFASGPAVASDGALTFTPALNINGSATVAFRVLDDGGTADGGLNFGNTETVTIVVRPVNDAPVVLPDSVTATVGQPLTINVLANDSDVDLDTIRVLSFTAPSHGSVRRQGNYLLYNTRLTAAGSDTFTYTVTDDRGGVANGSVAITVVDTIAPRIQTVRLYYGPAAYVDASALARAILPWERLHRIALVFSEGVVVDPAALTLSGTGGTIPTTFSYDAATRIASWAPTVPIGNQRVTMRLTAAGVRDESGNPVAADWARTLGLLAGDFDGNGIVNNADLRAIKRKIGKLNRFADIDGSRLVDGVDFALALANKGKRFR